MNKVLRLLVLLPAILFLVTGVLEAPNVVAETVEINVVADTTAGLTV